MAKKSNFGPDFVPFVQNLPSKSFFSINLALLVVKRSPKLLCYAIQDKTNEESFRKCQKT